MTTSPNPGDLRVWHIPQVPGKPFRVAVATVEEGRRLCSVLADYDLFQYRNRIKPDYCNVNGVEMFEGEVDGWCDVDPDICYSTDGLKNRVYCGAPIGDCEHTRGRS